jgi:hypothetical protein
MSRLFASQPVLLTRSLAVAGLLAAACLGTSAASAADCVNGYRTIGNDVIVLCDDGPSAFGATALYQAPEAAAPQIVGSLPDAVRPASRSMSRSMMADSAQDCQPGQYWSFALAESGNVLLAC